jgi:hypothetical protein
MSQRKLHALLVGIDDYPIEAHRLFGCHNDVQAAKEFLENRTNRNQYELKLKTLLSREATRTNIVRAFEEHLGQAESDDLVFFYYSGHGSQEKAGSFFSHLEPDGMNETLVCWDSRIEDGMDLADKELATLIQLVSKKNPHIVVLLDCCHSGTGSRYMPLARNAQDYLVRQSPMDERVRPLDSYILPRDLQTDRSVLGPQSTQRLRIPDGRHIALTAAESFELAKETTLGNQRRGVFSYSLMEILQNASGDFTYDDLIRRTRSLVGKRTFEQTPTLFATHAADLNSKFLDGSTSFDPTYFALSFDRQHGWMVDGGSVHGLVKGKWGESSALLSVFPDDGSEMEDLGKSLGEVEITDTAPNQSIVRPVDGLQLDREATYRCRILSLPVEPNLIYFHGDAEGLEAVRSQLEKGGEAASYLQETRDLAQADYKLIALRKQYIISRAADGSGDPAVMQRDGLDYRPLVEQVAGYGSTPASQVLSQLAHIAKWERSLELRNPSSRIGSGGLKIELWHPIEDRRLEAGPAGFQFPYDHQQNPEGMPLFRLKVVNHGPRKLFFSLLLFTSQFEVYPYLLSEGGLWLEPGQEAWGFGGEAIPGMVSDQLVAFGVRKTTEHLKLIASTSRFHPEMLELKGLGEPKPAMRTAELSVLDRLLAGSQERSLRLRTRPSGSLHDWNTNELSLVIERKN